MIEHVHHVGFGRPASEALSGAIRGAQAVRPLAPVTVVVPSHLAGLSARRTLSSGAVGGRGLVNVAFVTALRLAELLAADLPGGRRRLTNPVLASAVRRALAEDPRPFGEVAEHVATEAAVAATYAELSRLSPAALAAVTADPHGAVAVSLHHRVARHLGGFDDETAVVRAVLDHSPLDHRAAALGHVVWYLPDRLSAAQADLVGRVLRVCPATVIVGLTGDEDADLGTRQVCAAAGVVIAEPAAAPLPHADRIVSVADADQEVGEALAEIFALLADGVPADRIGLFYPVADPYLRIIEHRLAAARLTGSGPRAARLGDSVPARLLRAALTIGELSWRRDKLLELVAAAPVRLEGRRVDTTEWDRLSRLAGVVGGIDDWRRKLAGLIADSRATADIGEPGSATQRGAEQQASTATELLDFVEHLVGGLGRVDGAPTWHAKTAAAESLLNGLLGSPAARLGWPDDQREAHDRVIDALRRLSKLDTIEPRPSRAVFRRALDSELDTPSGRSAPYGTGIVYGALVTATGQDLDAVFVVGMVEGLCPMAGRDEALLSPRARLAAGGELLTAEHTLADQHRALLAALSAAPAGRRTFTVARGDLRSSRQPLPSRWLLDSASALNGRQVFSTELRQLQIDGMRVVPSYADSWKVTAHSPSLRERDLASLWAYVRKGGDAADHPVSVPVRRALAMQRARRSTRFTEFDGNLGGATLPSPGDGQALISATRLETWASCGFRYFLQFLLGIAVLDDPERIVTVSPLDRGSALHEVLARFVQEAIVAGAPRPDESWTVEDRTRLHRLADECFDELSVRGRSGRPLLWTAERAQLHRQLDEFLVDDDALRAATGGVPIAVEQRFGMGDEPSATILVGGRRQLRLRGAVDRVDATAGGGLAIYDYKSGRGRRYDKLTEDPVLAGTTLQLGVYAEAMGQRFAAEHVDSHYWLIQEREVRKRRKGYQWGDSQRARFDQVLGTILDGIDDGVFAQQPGELSTWTGTHENCRFCDFDGLCPTSRAEHAQAHAGDPALAVLDGLARPRDDE